MPGQTGDLSTAHTINSGAIEIGLVVADRYRIVRKIGEGGMGAVYEACNTQTDKRVAIKWMHPEIARHAEGAERFAREGQAASRIHHRNVIDVYDVIVDGNGLFLVMEYLEGESLRDLMARGNVPMQQVLSQLVGAMRGVSAAHGQSVIHRDIKPENIFLASEDAHLLPVAKVLDFGLSKITDSGIQLTNPGVAMGSPQYMSMEQHTGLSDIDGRTDIYAFGVIIYEIVTGQLPFDAPSYPLLVNQMFTLEAEPAHRLCPWVPEPLSRVIARAMAKEREERHASLDELIAELEPLIADLPARVAETPKSLRPPVPMEATQPQLEAPPSLRTRLKRRIWPSVILWSFFVIAAATLYPVLHAAPTLEHFASACRNGDAKACFSAAELSDSTAAATLFYEQACGYGHADACHLLADHYADGTGVPRDSERAAALYTQACTMGHTQACRDLMLELR